MATITITGRIPASYEITITDEELNRFLAMYQLEPPPEKYRNDTFNDVVYALLLKAIENGQLMSPPISFEPDYVCYNGETYTE